ncbi:hypothetical protein NE237_033194 [Protea cynaroides]|uniref:Nucleolus and neural progenitor protein-like N-terminal domain-containing protein n=1 Tax=Protea cynaroides TaxID=273540 RepID=A0A9Q0L4K5_9MAGN|nr:hypothetical protein NE237_033194 [Protea cynaroides]
MKKGSWCRKTFQSSVLNSIPFCFVRSRSHFRLRKISSLCSNSKSDYHMGEEDTNLEERLKSFLVQLQTESGILERLIYKGKNQHRRSLYFQYLLKVRRDVKLLQSARLGDILKHLFPLINGNKPSQSVHLLESLKRRKVDRGKANFLERLLGVARLLSEMVEPMLKAAVEISSLLARSFFMGFSQTILALLARLRVLVQQMLLDIVTVFNMVSSLAQKKHSLKFIQEGIEVFREYYPSNDEVITLECIWQVDKFVLLEKTNRCDIKNQDTNLELKSDTSLGSSMIKYQSIEAWLGEDEACNMDKGNTFEKLLGHSDAERHKTDASTDPFIIGDNQTQVEDCANDGGHLENSRSPGKNSDLKSSIVASTSPCPEHQSGSGKVAFVSVRKSAPPDTNEVGFVEATTNVQLPADENEDSLFSLLSGNLKDSIF